MQEYEFRLVVRHTESFESLLNSLGYLIQNQCVEYAPPHFRFKGGRWETKRVIKTSAVYHDGLWFRWVHSLETPFHRWSRKTCRTFLHQMGNFQNPFRLERRRYILIDDHAQLYTFKDDDGYFRLIFEWEYGTFPHRLTHIPRGLVEALRPYRHIYEWLRPFQSPQPIHPLQEKLIRKPVTCVQQFPSLTSLLYAHKVDGTFGLIFSYADHVKEKWEGSVCRVRWDVTLGDNIVFAAEKMEGDVIVLLDVYQVYGVDTSVWSRRAILTEFLPKLAPTLPPNYQIQQYREKIKDLPPPSLPTDGWIAHDTHTDTIFKKRWRYTLDLVHHSGYFWLPNDGGKIQVSQPLENGYVYEVHLNGEVVRKRIDRFTGNTSQQLERIFKCGGPWMGAPIKPIEVGVSKKKLKRKQIDKKVRR